MEVHTTACNTAMKKQSSLPISASVKRLAVAVLTPSSFSATSLSSVKQEGEVILKIIFLPLEWIILRLVNWHHICI